MSTPLISLLDRYRKGHNVLDQIIELGTLMGRPNYTGHRGPRSETDLLQLLSTDTDVNRDAIRRVEGKFFGGSFEAYDIELTDYVFRVNRLLVALEKTANGFSTSPNAELLQSIAYDHLAAKRIELEERFREALQDTDNIYVALNFMDLYETLRESDYLELRFSPELNNDIMLFKLRHGPDIQDLQDRINSFLET